MSANRAPAAIPYDLRKKHIPRIPSPAPNQDPAGNYTPMAAARKIRKMRQKKVSEASRASGARSSAKRPQAKAPVSQKRSLPAPSNTSKRVRFEISNEAVTESVPEAVDDMSDDAPVDTPANAPDEVSDLQESIDNESPREPPAENEEEEAARALYTTKERFKKLVYKRRVEEARRRLQEAEEDTYIPTSDIEEEMDELLRTADYPVALYLRIYLNKMLVVCKALPDSTRHTLDIADIEEIFLQSLQPFVKDEDYEVISRTAIVRLATGRGGSKAHDIDDFTNAEAEQILALLDRQHRTFPRSQIQLHFEIKVVCEALQGNKKKSRHYWIMGQMLITLIMVSGRCRKHYCEAIKRWFRCYLITGQMSIPVDIFRCFARAPLVLASTYGHKRWFKCYWRTGQMQTIGVSYRLKVIETMKWGKHCKNGTRSCRRQIQFNECLGQS